MKTMRIFALASLLTLSMASAHANQANFEKVYNEALSTHEQADKLGFAWRDVEELLENAKKAADAKDWSTAQSLADEALAQAQYAIKQAEQQKNAGPGFE